jgi:hypothetical protein
MLRSVGLQYDLRPSSIFITLVWTIKLINRTYLSAGQNRLLGVNPHARAAGCSRPGCTGLKIDIF